VIQGVVSADYKTEIRSINYLFDYSEYMIKNRKYDDKILNWQIENSYLLKPMGLDFQFLKSVN
jgi:hypothetical protein